MPQILCLADAILFTERCEESIREGRLTNFKKELEVLVLPQHMICIDLSLKTDNYPYNE